MSLNESIFSDAQIMADKHKETIFIVESSTGKLACSKECNLDDRFANWSVVSFLEPTDPVNDEHEGNETLASAN